MNNLPRERDLCPQCGSELRVSWCAKCFGTGILGKRKCRTCGGRGTTVACPSLRSHKPLHSFLGWAQKISKRVALF
jgi:hypothetical protein